MSGLDKNEWVAAADVVAIFAAMRDVGLEHLEKVAADLRPKCSTADRPALEAWIAEMANGFRVDYERQVEKLRESVNLPHERN